MSGRKGPKPVVSTLEMCNRAAEMLRAAGFEFRNASMKTEACYYAMPGRKELLRVAAHSKGKEPNGMLNVVAKLTFNGGNLTRAGEMRLHPSKHYRMVAMAMGIYMLRCGGYKDAHE